MKTRFFLFALVSFSFTDLIGQSVDPLTGRAQMSVSLFGLSYGGITVPVSISHHGSAMRVREGEGACGIGWNLNAGGAVTRVVRGLPDDYSVSGSDQRKGWLYNTNAQDVQDNITSYPDDNFNDVTDETTIWSFIDGRGYTKDTEPDVFYISAPGLAAQFVFGTDGQPKLLAYQDISITVTRQSGTVITQFVVQTPAGLIYTFSTTEGVNRQAVAAPDFTSGGYVVPDYFLTTYNYYQSPLDFTEAWNLASITSLSSDAQAAFTYSTSEDGFSAREFWNRSGGTSKKLYTLNDKRTSKQLTGISLGTSSIGFTWNENTLSKAELTESLSGQNKKYGFYYFDSYHSSDAYPRLHRYFLQEVKPEANCISFPSYQFKYKSLDYANANGVSVPFEMGGYEDHWGYFSSGNIASVVFFSSESIDKSGALRYRLSPPASATGGTTLSPGTVHFTATDSAAFGALNEISYPEGGVTKITYEPNTYVDSVLNTTVTGAGVRVKSIISYPGEQAYGRMTSDQRASHAIEKLYEYTLAGSSTTSGRLTYPPVYALSNGTSFVQAKESLGEPSEVLYSRSVEKITGKGKTVYEFNVPGMYPSISDGDWRATKTYIARYSTATSAGNLKNGPYTYPYPPNTNYNLDRGTMSAMKVYAEDGTLMRQRTVTYSHNPSSPTTVYGLRFERIGDIFHFGKYKILTGLGNAISQEVIQEASEQTTSSLKQTTTSYTYGGTPVLLQQVVISLPDGSQTKQVYKYARDFSITNPLGDAATAIKAFNDSGRKSQLIETLNYLTPYNESEYVTGASLVVYKSFSGRTLPYQIYSFLNTTGFSESVATTVSGQQRFDFDTDYRLIKTIENYTSSGLVLDETDDRKNRVSTHHSSTQSIGPVASFSNAKAQQTVFEGFETTTGYGLTVSSGSSLTYPTGWTGEKAIELPSGRTLTNANVEKNGNNYRVSCWVKAGQASAITFRALNNGTTEVSGSPTTLEYTSSMVNQWTYLEKTMNVTNANSTFKIEVSTNATVSIDDILAIPSAASAALATYSPLNGVTSQTDDRGNSVRQTYDLMGRKISTLDRKRNLVARNEYQTQKPAVASLSSVISSSATSYLTGNAVTFTAGANCQSGLSYEWTLNGSSTVLSTASTLTNTFTQQGNYSLKLKVSNASLGSFIYYKDLCVELNPNSAPSVTVENVSGITNPAPNIIKECYDTYSKRFTVTNIPDCTEDLSVAIKWEKAVSGGWTSIGSGSPFEYTFGAENATIRCLVNMACSTSGVPQCLAGTRTERIIETTLTWQTTGNCQ